MWEKKYYKNTCTYITACGIPRTQLGVTPASEEVGTDSWVVRALAFVDWKEIGQISLARLSMSRYIQATTLCMLLLKICVRGCY